MTMLSRLVILAATSLLACSADPSIEQTSASAAATTTAIDGSPLPAETVTRILGPVRQFDLRTITDARPSVSFMLRSMAGDIEFEAYGMITVVRK